MNLQYKVFCFRVRASGYDEKCQIIRDIVQEMGQEGIKEFAKLLNCRPKELYDYAVLPRFLEDRNRGRRQRKPKFRPTAGEQISPLINKELQRWNY